MNYKEEIKKKEAELAALKEKQDNLEKNCNHIWGKTKFDPEAYKQPVLGPLLGNGSDPYPSISSYETRYKNRWSRTCERCGKVEYTYTEKPSSYEPAFN